MKLGDCLSMIENGATIKQIEGAGGYPITRIETLSNDRFNRDRLGYADINDISNYKSHILDDEDLIMSHINSRPFLGRTVIYLKKEDEDIIHGMNVLRIKTKREILNPFYAYYYFKTPHFRKAIDNIRTDAINQSSINTNNIKDIKIHIPSLSNQESIVSALRSIDKKIELNERLNAELEAMAKQLYDYWFVQFDFPDENGNPYKSSGGKMVYNSTLKREIPEGWNLSSINDILDKVITTPRLMTDEYLKQGLFPVIDQTTDQYIIGFTNRKDAVSQQYPAIVFGDHSCVVKYINFPFVRGADGTQIILSKNENISIEYLYFYIKNINISKGYARHYSFVKDYPLIIPSNSLSIKYSSVVTKYFEKIKQLKFENIYLTHLRDSLLPMLMNGQVTVE